jgi:signal peptidase I
MAFPDPIDVTKHWLMADVLRSHGKCCLQVSGSSMLPGLWPGEMVQIERRTISQLIPGDIVFYEREGRFFLHRLAEVRTTLSEIVLITRGDSLQKDDPPVPANCFLGILAGVLRGGDWVAVRRRRSAGSRFVAACLSRSSFLVRLLLLVRSRCDFTPSAGVSHETQQSEVSL